jgi:tetratricopeptide (TPR) repeat protein
MSSPSRTDPERMTMPGRARSIVLVLLLASPLLGPGCAGSGGSEGASEKAPPPTRTRLDRRGEAQDAAANATRLRNEGVEEEALAEFERAIAINPELTIAYIGAAEIHTRQGNFEVAEQRYRKATEIEPANFEAQFGHGLVLQMLDRVADAIRAYLRALAIRPNDFEANLNVATAYMQVDEPRQARPYAERAVRLDPQSGRARANLGAVYGALELHDAAVIEYQQAAELMELSPELLLNMADSLGKINRHAEMAATLEQLIRIEASTVAFERLGSALFRLKNYERALAAFRRATELDPNHYPAWNGVGVCLLNQYLWSERQDDRARQGALEALRRSLQIKTNQPRIIELVRRYG